MLLLTFFRYDRRLICNRLAPGRSRYSTAQSFANRKYAIFLQKVRFFQFSDGMKTLKIFSLAFLQKEHNF